jgi:hypothetical protein
MRDLKLPTNVVSKRRFSKIRVDLFYLKRRFSKTRVDLFYLKRKFSQTRGEERRKGLFCWRKNRGKRTLQTNWIEFEKGFI